MEHRVDLAHNNTAIQQYAAINETAIHRSVPTQDGILISQHAISRKVNIGPNQHEPSRPGKLGRNSSRWQHLVTLSAGNTPKRIVYIRERG
jgi:hypothetical protein